MSSFFEKLATASARNRSLLCVGLDPTPAQIPARYLAGAATITAAILAWNRAIIEQTRDLVCCYKPNIAFYEALGAAGMELLRQTLALIPSEIPVLLDAKRGDIGPTAAAYAGAAFNDLQVDAITLSPYLGKDSVAPFLNHEGKGVFVLCHTSNPSAERSTASPTNRSICTSPAPPHSGAIRSGWWLGRPIRTPSPPCALRRRPHGSLSPASALRVGKSKPRWPPACGTTAAG
jgi:orotidine 5'-phosphate decarboxylase subfamily 2